MREDTDGLARTFDSVLGDHDWPRPGKTVTRELCPGEGAQTIAKWWTLPTDEGEEWIGVEVIAVGCVDELVSAVVSTTTVRVPGLVAVEPPAGMSVVHRGALPVPPLVWELSTVVSTAPTTIRCLVAPKPMVQAVAAARGFTFDDQAIGVLRIEDRYREQGITAAAIRSASDSYAIQAVGQGCSAEELVAVIRQLRAVDHAEWENAVRLA